MNVSTYQPPRDAPGQQMAETRLGLVETLACPETSRPGSRVVADVSLRSDVGRGGAGMTPRGSTLAGGSGGAFLGLSSFSFSRSDLAVVRIADRQESKCQA